MDDTTTLDSVLNSLSEILPGILYLTSLEGAENCDEKANIGSVISLVRTERIQKKIMNRLLIEIDDDPEECLANHFDNTYRWIDKSLKSKEPTLVHCFAGVVIAYLMREYCLSFEKAYAYVKRRRPIVCPNEGFQTQLRMFEKRLKIPAPKDPVVVVSLTHPKTIHNNIQLCDWKSELEKRLWIVGSIFQPTIKEKSSTNENSFEISLSNGYQFEKTESCCSFLCDAWMYAPTYRYFPPPYFEQEEGTHNMTKKSKFKGVFLIKIDETKNIEMDSNFRERLFCVNELESFFKTKITELYYCKNLGDSSNTVVLSSPYNMFEKKNFSVSFRIQLVSFSEERKNILFHQNWNIKSLKKEEKTKKKEEEVELFIDQNSGIAKMNIFCSSNNIHEFDEFFGEEKKASSKKLKKKKKKKTKKDRKRIFLTCGRFILSTNHKEESKTQVGLSIQDLHRVLNLNILSHAKKTIFGQLKRYRDAVSKFSFYVRIVFTFVGSYLDLITSMDKMEKKKVLLDHVSERMKSKLFQFMSRAQSKLYLSEMMSEEKEKSKERKKSCWIHKIIEFMERIWFQCQQIYEEEEQKNEKEEEEKEIRETVNDRMEKMKASSVFCIEYRKKYVESLVDEIIGSSSSKELKIFGMLKNCVDVQAEIGGSEGAEEVIFGHNVSGEMECEFLFHTKFVGSPVFGVNEEDQLEMIGVIGRDERKNETFDHDEEEDEMMMFSAILNDDIHTRRACMKKAKIFLLGSTEL